MYFEKINQKVVILFDTQMILMITLLKKKSKMMYIKKHHTLPSKSETLCNIFCSGTAGLKKQYK